MLCRYIYMLYTCIHTYTRKCGLRMLKTALPPQSQEMQKAEPPLTVRTRPPPDRSDRPLELECRARIKTPKRPITAQNLRLVACLGIIFVRARGADMPDLRRFP